MAAVDVAMFSYMANVLFFSIGKIKTSAARLRCYFNCVSVISANITDETSVCHVK